MKLRRRTRGAACFRRLGLLVAPLWLAGCELPPATSVKTVELSGPERMELQNRALDQLLAAADSDREVTSCNAIEALVQVAPRDGLPAFRKALAAQSPVVRYAGYVALGEVRAREQLDAFKRGVADPHPNVRLAAAFAACRCGQTGYARILVEALTSAPEERLRAEAATLIGRLDEPRAVRWLRRALKIPANERSPRVRLAIAGALARVGDAGGLEELITYARGETVARTEALLQLAQVARREQRDMLLVALLGPEEEYLEARLIAARALGKLGHKDGFDLAMNMLTFEDPNRQPTPENPERTFAVRSLAIHALAEIGDRRALGHLREIAAKSDDPRLQVAASYAICRILPSR